MKIRKIFFVFLLLSVLDVAGMCNRLSCMRKKRIGIEEIDYNPEEIVISVRNNRPRTNYNTHIFQPRVEEYKAVFCTGITMGVIAGVVVVEIVRSLITE